MTKAEHLSEEALTLWNEWGIRGLVLLSLLLQIILIIFGSRRKTIARSWIRVLVWSAYLSADMVATVALGNLARSQINSSGGGSSKANNSIQEFWAPFLLLHLGGPDTITAYSIEDNELWLRHLLNLAVQVGVAFYVFSRSWDINNILTFIAVPMFIVGIIKYAERTWVLRSSCSKHMKDSSLSIGLPSSLEGVPEQSGARKGIHLLRQAFSLFRISMYMMQDLLPSISPLIFSQRIISANSAEDAFKIVEIELGLIYDMLYTKVPLINSCLGIILRSITFLLSFAAFVTFSVMIDKHAYSTTDRAITYLLLVGALVLEICAFLCVVFSDQTLIWLSTDEGGNTPACCARPPAICSLIGKLTPEKRWSRSIAQHNLINSCIKDKPVKCLEWFGIHEMMKQMYVIRKDMKGELKHFIFAHLQEKGEMIMKKYNFLDAGFRGKISDQRGDGVLEARRLLEAFKWCSHFEFSRSIIVWHLATDFCFYSMKGKFSANCLARASTSKLLSEYMVYLVVNRPNMLPQGIGDVQGSYRQTREHMMKTDPSKYQRLKSREHLVNDIPQGIGDLEGSYQQTREHMMETDTSKYRRLKTREYLDNDMLPEMRRTQDPYDKSALVNGCKLAIQLLGFEELPWEMINEVWIEMLAYAAAHCPWKEHAQQLRRGGELLTHVRFLMLHFGLSPQYQFNFVSDKEFHSKLSREERHRFYQALGAANMLDEDISSPTEDGVEPDDKEITIILQILKEITELSPGETFEGSVEFNGGQGLVHDEMEEVPQPIGANDSPLSSNIANLKEVEELKKVLADKDRELERKERDLAQMRSLLPVSTQQQ